MLLLGLTGSIATGKSTVSSLLAKPPYRLPIIDADILARKVVEPGTSGYDKIVRYFSASTPDLLLPDARRSLNRPVLGRRVFGDDPQRRKDRAVLNGIVHPAVRREIYKALLRCYIRGCWAVVLDIPLLFESGLDLLCGTVLVVAVRDPKLQIQRLLERDSHLTEDDARSRVLSQGDVRAKARRAEARGRGSGYVAWNDGSREQLEMQVKEVMEDLRRSSPTWWVWSLLLVPPLAVAVGGSNVLRAWWVRRRWQAGKEMKTG
ncbi:MAG: hypothetical protein M1816_002564 [Peltula sp. TS41687]|nr:MAG: hypothetical protein M1816_002564 [Peltula sp. TS41687]